VIYREEVTGTLFVIADINAKSSGSWIFSKRNSVAKGKYRKTPPEERARWRENHERLARILERITREEGITREDALRALEYPRERAG
jgi:hypothetical protein